MSIVLTSRSGPDGKLRLEIPVSAPDAEFEVEVVVRPKAMRLTPAQYAAWVQSMAGSITDPTFERPPQLPLEEREPLS
jgi:hypothetical protein